MTLPAEKYSLLRLDMRGVMSGNGYAPAPNMSEQDLDDFVGQLATDAGVVGTPIPPVLSIQVAALPSYVATTTTLMGVANGALDPAVFGVSALAVGARVEKNNLGTAAADNGIYVVAQLGSPSTPWIMTRSTELDSSAELSAGATFVVLSGASTGQARYLVTPAPITVGVTPLAFGPVREKALLHVDLTKPPYNMVGYPNPTAANPAAFTGSPSQADLNTAALRLFNRNCQMLNDHGVGNPGNGALVGDLPYGLIPVNDTVLTPGDFCLNGRGQFNSKLYPGDYVAAGPLLLCGQITYPTLVAVGDVGDTGSVGLPLVGSVGANRWYNLTEGSGLDWITPQSQVEFRVWLGNAVLPADNGHVLSCRGRRLHNDTLQTAFSIYVGTDGRVTATLRTLDANNLKATGGSSPPAVTLSGTAISAEVPLHIEILSSTTFRYSVNLKFTWSPNNTDGAEACTFTPGGTYTLGDRANGVVLNFPSGTYSAGQTYSTIQQVTLVSGVGSVVAADGKRKEIALCYDGTAVTLAVNKVFTTSPSQAAGPDANGNSASVAMTGKFLSFAFEETHLGSPHNATYNQEEQDGNPLDATFLGLTVNNTVGVGGAAVTPGTLGPSYPAGFVTQLRFVPYDPAVRPTLAYAENGVLQFFRTQVIGGSGIAFAQDTGLAFAPNFCLSNMSFDTGATTHPTAVMVIAPHYAELTNIGATGNGQGIRATSKGFYNRCSACSLFTNGRYNFASAGSIGLPQGANHMGGGKIVFQCAGAGPACDYLFVDCQGQPDTAVLLNATTALFSCLVVSNESASQPGAGQGRFPGGMICVDVNTFGTCKFLSGNVNAGASAALVLSGAPGVNQTGQVEFGLSAGCTGKRFFEVSDPALSTATTPYVPYVKLLDSCTLDGPNSGGIVTQHPEFFLRKADEPVALVTLGNADVTLDRSMGESFYLPASTLTGAHTATLATTKAIDGQKIHAAIEVQSFNYTFGPDTVTAGNSLYRWYVRRGGAWIRYQ